MDLASRVRTKCGLISEAIAKNHHSAKLITPLTGPDPTLSDTRQTSWAQPCRTTLGMANSTARNSEKNLIDTGAPSPASSMRAGSGGRPASERFTCFGNVRSPGKLTLLWGAGIQDHLLNAGLQCGFPSSEAGHLRQGAALLSFNEVREWIADRYPAFVEPLRNPGGCRSASPQ